MAVWSRLADADADVEAEEAGQHHIGKVARHKRDLKRAASTNVVAKLCLFFIQVSPRRALETFCDFWALVGI
jgi:hypothetical protein